MSQNEDSKTEESRQPETSGKFIPGEEEWIRSHYYDVPQQTVEFCGDIAGKCVLNLGCGEMLTDVGLLNKGVKRIVGLDLHEKPAQYLEDVVEKLRRHGIAPPDDYGSRIAYRWYGGTAFPFDDGEFDLVFSWSAFEHVHDVPAVLSEIRRVLSADGCAFVQVYPWYHSFAGSHLSDFIREPYFHLTRQSDWVRGQLEQYLAEHPADRDFVLDEMYQAYLSLNRYSANRFYRDVVAAGFRVVKARLITYDLDLSEAPPNADFSDLMICGTMMLARKTSTPSV
jgi:SAM-dependent methyltransferase